MLIIRVSKQRGDAASASKLLHLSKAVCGTTNVIYAMYIEPLNTLEHICGSTASEMTPFPF